MSSTNAPFGLRPVFHPSGQVRPFVLDNGIADAFASNILNGQPVKIVADGTIEDADAGDRFVGSFDGAQWVDTTGRPRISNYWPANTAKLSGTTIIANFYRDPTIMYEIQADGSLTQANIGSQADFNNATAGSTVTGFSQCTLNTATLTSSGSAGLRIINIPPGPDNAPGDAYTIAQVQISEHQDVADIVAY